MFSCWTMEKQKKLWDIKRSFSLALVRTPQIRVRPDHARQNPKWVDPFAPPPLFSHTSLAQYKGHLWNVNFILWAFYDVLGSLPSVWLVVVV